MAGLRDYEANLESNLLELNTKAHSGSYRALPVRRRFIPKPDGKQRPLGIAALEDKIVQRALVEVLNAVYEKTSSASRMGSGPGAASMTRWTHYRWRSAIPR